MRIGMILEVPFPPHPRVEKEMRALTRAGHEVHVLAFASAGRPKTESLDGLGTVHRVPFPMWLRPFRLLYGGRALYNRYWLPHVRRFAEEVRADALHVHDLPLAGAAHRVAAGRDIPLVLDFHENWPGFMVWAGKGYNFLVRLCIDHCGWRRYEAEAVRWAEMLIVVDPTNADRLTGLYGLPAEQIAEVSNTPELDRLLPRLHGGARREGVTLLYMGGLDFGRGLQTVIEAMALRKQDLLPLRFVVVGEGPYRKELERRTRERGLTDRVEFHGWQPYDRLGEYIGSADVGAVPHVRDELTDTTIPNKIFEYMAGGLPVLSSDCVPLARVVEETRCGLVFRSEDAASCGDALVRLCGDAALRRELGEQGRAAVLRKYNWDETAKSLTGIYERLTQHRSPGECNETTKCRNPSAS
jgi:glycosyltransferase involved in cell wall biosynthesis